MPERADWAAAGGGCEQFGDRSRMPGSSSSASPCPGRVHVVPLPCPGRVQRRQVGQSTHSGGGGLPGVSFNMHMTAGRHHKGGARHVRR